EEVLEAVDVKADNLEKIDPLPVEQVRRGLEDMPDEREALLDDLAVVRRLIKVRLQIRPITELLQVRFQLSRVGVVLASGVRGTGHQEAVDAAGRISVGHAQDSRADTRGVQVVPEISSLEEVGVWRQDVERVGIELLMPEDPELAGKLAGGVDAPRRHRHRWG